MIDIFIKLLLLFTVIPIVELALLIEIGKIIGVLTTIGIVFITGIIGAALARQQGFIVLTKIREQLSRGEIPTGDLIEALLILIGGVTLITPGILTDITGFLLIIPFSRAFFAKLAVKIFKRYINKNEFNTKRNFTFHSNFNNSKENQDKDYVDIEYEEDFEDKDK